jgi:arsenite-transporting ATPase
MFAIENLPKNLFFTGKGGVGKTTTSAATAIALADGGKMVLLVSTDPASNLDEVLGLALSADPVPVPKVPGLFAANVDPVEAAAAYREKLVGPYRGLLPDAAVRRMEEQLSGACTVEIAAFNEFARLMGNPEAVKGFDHIIFDTAPTGHTLRLLSLPAAWSDFIDTNSGGTSCLGPLAGLQAQQQLYTATRQALADPEKTLVVVVSRPDEIPLAEAARAASELAELGVRNQHLVLNGLLQLQDGSDPTAAALIARGQKALAEMPAALTTLPRTDIPLSGTELVGIEALRNFFTPEITPPAAANPVVESPLPAHFDQLLDQLSAQSGGVIMTMGKGGVGKTTLAVNLATALAARGKKVHLTTTDPAAHVAQALGGRSATNLRVSRIDPRAETQAYSQDVLATAGAGLDEEARALLEEDLRSPCTEEIAVFRAFARVVAEGDGGCVVIDTAPTGHTLLLLDASESYHREVSRSMSDIPEAVRQLLPHLRDPDFTRVFLVTLAEATPVHEALTLQADLRRAGIEPAGWLINQSLAPLTISDPLLKQRRSREFRYIDQVVGQNLPTFLIPWQANPLSDAASAAPQINPGHKESKQ